MTALVTLTAVKQWLNTGTGPYPPGSDDLLTRMIGSVSQFVTSYLSRAIVSATATEVYNGNDMRALPLRRTPVIQVRSLTIGTIQIPARLGVCQAGYVADATSVYVEGYCFHCGIQNISVTYDAGFQQSDTWTVPTPSVIDTPSLARPWNTDRGVAYASGAAFALVKVPPTVAGTYQLGPDSLGNTQYVFAAADIGASVVITYGYTPEDVQQAIVELVGERYRSRTRIGEVSQNLKGMVVSFSQRDMNAAIKSMLAPYRNVSPIQ